MTQNSLQQDRPTEQSDGSRKAHERVLAEKWDDRSTFTVDEAGEILGLSRWSAYVAAKNGVLPTVRVGRRLIVPRVGLERMLLVP